MYRTVFAALVIAVLSLSACQSDLPTRRSEATAGELPTGTLPAATEQPTSPPTAAQVDTPSPVDELLARSAVNNLLTALVFGNGAEGLDTWLTDRALREQAPDILERLNGGNLPYDGYRVLSGEWENGQTYRAKASLSRSDKEGQETTEPVSLRVVQQGAEWLVDELTFGRPTTTVKMAQPQAQAAPAKAATTRPRPTPSPTAAALSGKLAFMTSTGGPIYVVNADGSGLRQVADGMDPAISPDGSRVAFVRQGLRGGVYTVNLDGSGETNRLEQNKPRQPSWSPDGRRIICSYERERVFHQEGKEAGVGYWTEVWALAVSDLDKNQTADWPSALHSYSPAWSPLGDLIAYDNGYGVDLMNLEGKNLGLTSLAGDGSPAWSPDGKQVAFQGWAHDHLDIMVVNADKSGRRALTSTPFGAEKPQNNVSPAWSPDGRSIAFVTDRSGRWEIWVMSADGSSQRPMFTDGLPGGLSISYGYVRERMISWGP